VVNKKRILWTIPAFIIPLLVYVITLTPSVGFIDTGELATVCVKLGIAHPTGYPLFSIFGNLFTYFPIGDEIYRLNLMTALITSAAIAILFNFFIFIYRIFIGEINAKKENKIKDDNIYFISFASCLVFAFSKTCWNTANGIEVYGLHILFIIIVIFIFVKGILLFQLFKNHEAYGETLMVLFAYMLGLSFANHMTTLFLALGFIYYYFTTFGFNKSSITRIIYLSLFFLAGLSVYTYFFIRADNPDISWGYPANFTYFIRHITAKQFNVWMFSSFDVTAKQFKYFISSYPKEFFYFPLILAVAGLVFLFKNNRKFFIFTILLFLFDIIYAFNYDIHDIDSYFLLAFLVTAIWIGFGISYLMTNVKANVKYISLISLFVPLIILAGNWKSNDESKNYYVKDYTINVFNSARQNSLILSTQWDFFISASWYFQIVKNYRPDVTVIDKELLRRSWYIRHIKIHFPQLYERCKQEFEDYSVELKKFEDFTDRYLKPVTEYDKQELIKINQTFIALLNSLVDKNYNFLNIYTTDEIERSNSEKFAKDYLRVNEGLLFRLTKDKNFDESYTEPEYKFDKSDENDYYHTFIIDAYITSYLYRANYLMNNGKFEKAEDFIKKARDINPQKPEIRNFYNRLNEMKNKQKQNIEK
jgi:hypothetical protein